MRSRPPGSRSRAGEVPSRPTARLSRASYRDATHRLVPARPPQPRAGTHCRKRGAARSTASRVDWAEAPRPERMNSRSGPSNSISSQSSRTSTGSAYGSRRASALVRVVLPAPAMPATSTLRRWPTQRPQAASTPAGHAAVAKGSVDTLVAKRSHRKLATRPSQSETGSVSRSFQTARRRRRWVATVCACTVDRLKPGAADPVELAIQPTAGLSGARSAARLCGVPEACYEH